MQSHSTKALICLLLSWSFFGCASSESSAETKTQSVAQVSEISILKLDSLRQAYPDAILLDVRDDEEWAMGHLNGASFISYDWDDRKSHLSTLPWDRPVLIYCEAGGRSGVMTEELRIIGHPRIVDLIGGISSWSDANRPVVFDPPVEIPRSKN
jgi:phage shock protein E